MLWCWDEKQHDGVILECVQMKMEWKEKKRKEKNKK